jgi:hypothetical protein
MSASAPSAMSAWAAAALRASCRVILPTRWIAGGSASPQCGYFMAEARAREDLACYLYVDEIRETS